MLIYTFESKTTCFVPSVKCAVNTTWTGGVPEVLAVQVSPTVGLLIFPVPPAQPAVQFIDFILVPAVSIAVSVKSTQVSLTLLADIATALDDAGALNPPSMPMTTAAMTIVAATIRMTPMTGETPFSSIFLRFLTIFLAFISFHITSRPLFYSNRGEKSKVVLKN